MRVKSSRLGCVRYVRGGSTGRSHKLRNYRETGLKMAANQANAPSSAPRPKFSKSDDLDLLRDVRECNPFKDGMQHPMRWTEIAVWLSAAKGKMFSARTVRDHTDLLLAQYADKDSKGLRR